VQRWGQQSSACGRVHEAALCTYASNLANAVLRRVSRGRWISLDRPRGSKTKLAIKALAQRRGFCQWDAQHLVHVCDHALAGDWPDPGGGWVNRIVQIDEKGTNERSGHEVRSTQAAEGLRRLVSLHHLEQSVSVIGAEESSWCSG